MKFCTQCGTQLEDNSRFCTNCGTPVGQPQQAAPQEQSWESWNADQQPQTGYQSSEPVPGYVPNQQPPKKKTGLIIGVAVGVVAVILAVVLLFAGKGGNSGVSVGGNNPAAWNGDYYGWWIISEVTRGSGYGEWYEDGNWWDACCTLDLKSDGTGNVIIWDEDLPKDNALCEIRVTSYVKDGVLHISPVSGYFMDGNIANNDIEILVDWDDDYEDVLTVFGSYGWDKAAFNYYMFMRPWGHSWSDVKTNDPGLLPANMDWYEELIHSGVSKAPNNIG